MVDAESYVAAIATAFEARQFEVAYGHGDSGDGRDNGTGCPHGL